MSNTGNVALEYTWMADTGDERATSPAEELLPPGLEGMVLALLAAWGAWHPLNVLTSLPVCPDVGSFPACLC